MYGYYPYQQNMAGGGVSQRVERRFSEELLEANVGRKIAAYMTYDSSDQWRDKVFSGTLRQVGRDYFVINDESTGQDVLLLNINISYIVFIGQQARLAPQ
ncbi:spore coat protein GerQ [Hazenella sp. IB182357]|uniref:Spore coat protein GerQ n=1 Tax=Polycladospora coralii TaxID=2771432 RepID=A0A926N6W1_9BACL|nr:spore coat protein GerQ [Polycladospora coralii]MBD1373624.1 spore coat protein GerQ [Polycladospora coralii]MBS7529666.1 spore coat protein GerQ [Polycladospora coralii]